MDYGVCGFLKLQVEILDLMNISHLPTALMKHVSNKKGERKQP